MATNHALPSFNSQSTYLHPHNGNSSPSTKTLMNDNVCSPIHVKRKGRPRSLRLYQSLITIVKGTNQEHL